MGCKRNAEARITALLFSLSAAAFLLLARAALLQPQRRRGDSILTDALLAALGRFIDGRGLLDLATRRNMVLLCHAILLLILRDSGLLGAPARRRARAETTGCAAAAADDSEQGVVVWQCPRQNRAAAVHDPGCHASAEAAATWAAAAAPAVAQAEEPAATAKEIVLVEKAMTNHLAGGRDRAAGVDLEQPQAAASATTGGKKSEQLDRRAIVVADDDDRNAGTVAEQTEEVELELADDRRIEEFISKQWSNIRQESLQLVLRPSSVSQQAAIPAC
ncbi:unnamed protein product [Urochloa humidicola]